MSSSVPATVPVAVGDRGGAGLHVAGAATDQSVTADLWAEGIAGPGVEITGRHDIGMAEEEERGPVAGARDARDDPAGR